MSVMLVFFMHNLFRHIIFLFTVFLIKIKKGRSLLGVSCSSFVVHLLFIRRVQLTYNVFLMCSILDTV